jgi:hypothetical protein
MSKRSKRVVDSKIDLVTVCYLLLTSESIAVLSHEIQGYISQWQVHACPLPIVTPAQPGLICPGILLEHASRSDPEIPIAFTLPQESNRVYSVQVLPGDSSSRSPDSPAQIEKAFWEFLHGFRVGGEFVYR